MEKYVEKVEKYVGYMKEYEKKSGKHKEIRTKNEDVGRMKRYRMAPSSSLYIAFKTWKNSESSLLYGLCDSRKIPSFAIYTRSVHVKKAKD